MTGNTIDYGASLQAYPNIRTAAEIVGVSPSTLSRREDIESEHRGDRDRVLPTAEVLRLAAIYRKRSINDVAQDLIDHAQKASPDEARRVESEVEEFFAGRVISQERRDDFLALARRLLPASLYNEVEATLAEEGEPLPDALMGDPPRPSS